MLKTQRLILKPYTEDDKSALIALLVDDEIKRTYMMPDFACEAEAERMFYKLVGLSHSKEHYELGIFLDTGELIGFVNDVEMEAGRIEMGYVVSPAHKGKGYASEAFAAVIEDLFKRGWREVTAGAFSENAASRRVMEKCGMTQNGRVESIAYHGRDMECAYYSIFNRDMAYPYGYCGMPCALCSRYRTVGASRCPGCSANGYYTDVCKAHHCCRGKKLAHCGLCGDFPCARLGSMSDFRDLNTDNAKGRTCELIAASGFDAWYAQYHQRADMLTTALEKYNDGRMKRYLCELFIQRDILSLYKIMDDAKHLSGTKKELGKAFKAIKY